jgi:predicted transposase YbfD/YdcC
VLGQEAVAEKSNEITAFPGAFRFPKPAAIAVIDTRVEHKGKIATARCSYITSRPLSAQALARAVRAHWAIETKLHWVLDVTFNEDRSRLTGHGAHNMAIVRHFAINLVRTLTDKISIKSRRKCAS